MSLSESEVQKIAWLARLTIDKQDIANYCNELSGILGLIEQMNCVQTTGITPIASPLTLPAHLRPDEVTEKNQREYFQKIAPVTHAGCYLVPKVIE